MSKKKMQWYDYIIIVILFIGGLNWGLVGIANINLVELIFGNMTVLARVIYSLVGVSAVVGIIRLISISIKR